MNKIPLCKYVAYNNPQGAKTILEAWGVPVKNTNKEALHQSLRALLRQEGEPVLLDLGNLHPDKDLILKVEEIKAEKSGKSSSNTDGDSPCRCGGGCKCENKSSYCGCSAFSGGGAWNANEGAYYSSMKNPIVDEFQVYGTDGPAENKKQVDKSIILFGGVAALLLYALYQKG